MYLFGRLRRDIDIYSQRKKLQISGGGYMGVSCITLIYPLFKTVNRDFPGGPVVKTLRFHCTGYSFDPWSGN